MRGLPPVPADVLRLELDVDVNDRRLTTGLWLLVPDLPLAPLSWVQALTASAFAYLLPGVTGVMHDGASVSTCRVAAGGIAGWHYAAPAPPNHGAYTGGQADVVACGVFVRGSSSARGSGSRLRFPGTPDDFVDRNWKLSAAGVSQLLVLASDITTFVSANTGPTGGPVVLGTLQRATTAGPRTVATLDPATAVFPSLRVEYLGRRFPRNRWISPL